MPDIQSGELLPTISIPQAKALTEKIRYAADDVKASMGKLIDALHESRLAGAHLALGISDWDSYAANTLQDVFEDLSPNARRELVASLHENMGMSIRSIASTLDMGKSSVHRALSHNRDSAPESSNHSGIDSVASAIARGEKPPPSSKPKPKPKAKRRNSYPPAEPVTTSVTSLQGRHEQSLRAAAEAIATLSTDSTYVARRGDVLAGLLEELKLRVDSALTQLDSVE